MQSLTLLGPQRPDVNLDNAFQGMDSSRPVAVISAGWQEAEGDIDDVHAIVRRKLVDLRLYQRAEELFRKDSALADEYRRRQDRLQALQRVHRIRLRQAMIAARQLLRTESDDQILRHEQRHAISQLRSLDRHHAKSIAAIHGEFDAALAERPSDRLARHVKQIGDTLDRSDIVLITGGNVAVLLNRLRLFGAQDMLAGKTVIAWSAGAMALTNHVVLYHDRTPLENRDAEILDRGLGILPNVVLLPDARHRLRRQDKVRVALFCRRFAPAACLTLDNGADLRYRDGHLAAATGVSRLMRGGTLRKVRAK